MAAFTQAPELETERLLLTAHDRADYAACLALWTDPAVTRFIGGKPSTPEEVWSRLLRYVGHWSVVGFGYWVIREKASGRFIGEAGLADFQRDLTPPLGGTPESGWVLSPSVHGLGYATEAMHRILRWSDQHLGPKTVCLIDPLNAPSIRVAQKIGYQAMGEVTYRGQPNLFFERMGRA